MSQEGAPSTSAPSAVELVAKLVAADDSGKPLELRALIERARSASSDQQVDEWAATILEALEGSPEDRDLLLSLLLLGFTNESLRERNHDAFIGEGRRLAILWERDGHTARAHELLEALCRTFPGERLLENELANLMRRSGNLDRLIERHIQRAEQAAALGRRREAITWLREALTLDGSRRDLARMIRDLTYADSHKVRWGRCIGLSGAALAVILGVAGLVRRERAIRAEYAAIPPALASDKVSTVSRLNAIEMLIAENVLWSGLFDAGRERALLRAQVARLDLQETVLGDQVREAEERAALEAQSLCDQARAQAGVGSLELALSLYQQALALAPSRWDGRERAEADRTAIRRFLDERESSGAPATAPSNP